jgi:hypothetical protein
MSWVNALAGKFIESYGDVGIDWSLYDDSGVNLQNPQLTYIDELLKRTEALYAIVGSFSADLRARYASLRQADGESAITSLWQAIDTTGAKTMAAADQGQATLTQPIKMSQEKYQNAILSTAAYTASAAQLHFDHVMGDAVQYGQITMDQLKEHADTVARMCGAFQVVDAHGGMNDMKASGTSGLGGPEIPVVLIALLGVAAPLALGYILWGVFVTLPAQKAALALCAKLSAAQSADAQSCIEAAVNSANPAQSNPFADPLKTLTWALAGGVIFYFGSLALPNILRAMEKRA